MAQIVDDTIKELNYTIEPLNRLVFVRTDKVSDRTASGLIVLPPKIVNFFGVLPHMRIVTAAVIFAGPEATLRVGERICFKRLHFARYLMFEDETFFGWIDETQVLGYAADDFYGATVGVQFLKSAQSA